MIVGGDDDALIVVADDDEAIRISVCELMQSIGLEAIAFASPDELLAADLPDRPGCFILDVRMPGPSGLDLQTRLKDRGEARPIIFLTAHGDVPMSVRAMKAGAVDFLPKPFRPQDLLDAVWASIEADRERRAEVTSTNELRSMFETLTVRERQVFGAVVQGRLNKEIAYELGISEVTVKLHRGKLMRKMKAAAVTDLVRAWEGLPRQMRS